MIKYNAAINRIETTLPFLHWEINIKEKRIGGKTILFEIKAGETLN
jgi:hypothetical protein